MNIKQANPTCLKMNERNGTERNSNEMDRTKEHDEILRKQQF